VKYIRFLPTAEEDIANYPQGTVVYTHESLFVQISDSKIEWVLLKDLLLEVHKEDLQDKKFLKDIINRYNRL
jgi:hypothetical protein